MSNDSSSSRLNINSLYVHNNPPVTLSDDLKNYWNFGISFGQNH